ncbi:MAG: sugar phosphate isomerase/epimerase [Planctomycetota bacterium]|nr:sugar phosphate isomerase/epimerase [Planctomycetota bacterium]
MKLGICLGCVPGATDAERYANAARAGFGAVEVAALADPGQLREHRELAARYGLQISGVMTGGVWEHPLSAADPAVRDKGVQAVLAAIEAAAALGADAVLVIPGLVTPDVTYEQAWERSARELRRLIPAAEKANVVLAIENVWNKFLLSPMEFVAYLDSFASPHVAAYFDVGNIVAYGYPDHWIRSLGRRVRRVHVKGFHAARHAWTPLREGTIDWAAVMKAFGDVGYDGYLTAELSPAGDDPIAGLRQIKADLDAIVAMGR